MHYGTHFSASLILNRRSFYRKKFRDNSEAKQQRTLFIRQGEVLIWQSKQIACGSVLMISYFFLSFVAIISGLLDKNVLLCGILQLPQPEFL